MVDIVRAKFRVDERNETSAGFRIKMNAVTSGSPENERFFKWTPGGSIELGTINPEAAKMFTPGKEVYVDFSLAPEPDAKAA